MTEIYDDRTTILDRMGFDDRDGEPVLRPDAAVALLEAVKRHG